MQTIKNKKLKQVNISNDAQQISGIFIKNIIQSSPAELCKQIKVCVGMR